MICLPEKGGKFPTAIHRTPYADYAEKMSEEEVCEKVLKTFSYWVEAGYALVYQQCRGTGKSSGDCIPFVNEREDSLFLQEWVRQQPFYNGEIFLFGRSYKSSVHLVTAPFADDIKGAVLEVMDSERYNAIYRNGFFKVGLFGNWSIKMYKKKRIRKKSYTSDSYRMLPLSDFSKTVFGEEMEDLDKLLRHPNRNDDFWNTRSGSASMRDALKNAKIPVLLTTGFYDIFTGGIFDMWRDMDDEARSMCALAVTPFNHSGKGINEPINFENGTLDEYCENYKVRWCDAIRGKGTPSFEKGKVTYYKLFSDQWCCDDFYDADEMRKFTLGTERVSYRYNPYAPAVFQGGLSAHFGGNAWQDLPNSRYDIISIFTPEFEEDTFIKGKIKGKLKVSSDCEDTCFYMRLSLCKEEGYYGLRDDINQISNFNADYHPGEELDMTFSFDEHAFLVKKGEKLRVDISSSAWPLYVPHTNQKGLFSEQTTAKVATNTVDLTESYIELPILKNSTTPEGENK